FAVALGLQRQSTRAVLLSLIPIAFGHALSIAAVVAVLAWLQSMIELRPLRLGAAAVLVAFGLYRLVARHPGRVGMPVNCAELTLWSFLMATAHGAGLMLIPVLLHMNVPAAAHSMHVHGLADSVGTGIAAVMVHTAAMLVVAGAIALVVYRWVGLAF